MDYLGNTSYAPPKTHQHTATRPLIKTREEQCSAVQCCEDCPELYIRETKQEDGPAQNEQHLRPESAVYFHLQDKQH